MYVNEKGSTVFAIYSTNDPDDPTILRWARGKKADQEYAKLNRFFEEERHYADNDRATFDRFVNDIKSTEGNTSNGVSYFGEQGTTEADVFLPFGESRSNGRGDYVDGSANLQGKELTEYNDEASEESDIFIYHSEIYCRGGK